jgi:hypothetical protein
MIMKGIPPRRFFGLLFLLAAGSFRLFAQEQSAQDLKGQAALQVDERTVLLLWSQNNSETPRSDAAQFMTYLIQSLRSALNEAGYPTVDNLQLASLTDKPSELALTYGKERALRWVFILNLTLSDRSLSWTIGAYDTKREALRASDSFSTFPGLSALPSLDDSCRRVVQAWLTAIAADPEVVNLAEYSQLFTGPQDGIEVWYGPAKTGVLAGTLERGTLEGRYLPFPQDQPLFITLYKEGFWPRSIILPKGVTSKTIKLPALQKQSVHVWGVGTGRGRLLGATYFYRYYPFPDRLFFRFDNSFWAGYNFTPGSVPFWHDELRFGMGLYLQDPVDSALRLAIGTGGSGIISYLPGLEEGSVSANLDMLLDPIWFSLEYHFPHWALFTEFRLPYATGSGFLSQGWVEAPNGGPFFLIGVLFK